MATDFGPVTARLRAEVAAHRLEFDAAQGEAAQLLDALCATLSAPPAGLLERLRAHLPWSATAPRASPSGRSSHGRSPRGRSPRGRSPRGVYLWGGVGRGKTLLMDLFFASLAHSPSGVRAERKHFYHFMRDVHAELAGIKQHESPLDTVARRWAERARVICLDEFFVTDIGDAMILSGLLEGLLRRGVVLVTTSNLPPQDLYKDGLQRQRFLPAIELICAHVDVLHLDGGADHRLRQLARAPTYLDDAEPGTQASLKERFDSLSGGHTTGRTTLEIGGRTLHAVDTGPGIAWFEFSELCEGPRSSLDYIEIARLNQSLVISHIPRFDAFNENAARRFIMLIDELYDRGVKTLVSAAVPPTELYRGDRLQFEFERAASRLIEMQTQEYLAGQHRP